VSQNGEPKKGFLRRVFDFFINPVAVFVYSFLFALLTEEKERWMIIGVGFVYIVGSVVYAIWHEKISAREAVEENQKLKREVKELEEERDGLKKAKDVLEKEVPELITYSCVEKEIKILDKDGNARFSMTHRGINESKTLLRRVGYVLVTEIKVDKNKLSNTTINNENVIPDVTPKQYGKAWRNQIFMETSEPVPDGEPIETHYEAYLEKEYASGFEGKTSSYHQVSLKTDKFSVVIHAPDGFYFTNPDFDVREIFSNIEVYHEKDRISKDCPPLPMQDRTKIVWKIANPRLSYIYILLFSLKKIGKKDQAPVPSQSVINIFQLHPSGFKTFSI